MLFSHGSSQNINNNDFDVFDYVIDQKQKISIDFIDNGNDAQGIGINAYIGSNEEAIKKASHFTSNKESFIYILSVDIEEYDLMNYREPDEIPVEELSEAIECFMEKLRILKGYEKKEYDILINSFKNNLFDFDLHSINNEFKKQGLNIVLDEYADPNDFTDFSDWKEQANEQYDMQEPCSSILEEGNPLYIAKNAIKNSDNLWETIKSIGETIAVHNTIEGTERYNKTFQESMTNSLKDHNLIAAYVNNEEFAVIFNTHEIDLVKKIDLNLKNDNKKIKRRKP
jgi:hypothetical protein